MSRYIDADAFEVFGYTLQDGTFDDGVQFVLEKIDEHPTADVVEVVHGEWVKDEEKSKRLIESIYICSACHDFEAWGEIEKDNWRYCPNCGARMDGGK